SALVDIYGLRRSSVETLRGGLGCPRVRKIKELVHAKMQDELTLGEMAQSVGVSTAHFSRMFRKTMGETPHQFVLWRRIERSKEMLRAREVHVLDVAIACGFKTQQHFARVFRHVCGASPTEYRREWSSRDPSDQHRSTNQPIELVSPLHSHDPGIEALPL